ncbi:MAG: hypothetical protein ACKOAM_01480 [Chakrabartia sp.]
MLAELIKFGVSLGSMLALAGFAWMLKLGGDIRIRDARHAREIAQEQVFDFIPVDITLDRAGMGALLRDIEGRQLLIRRHGAAFVGRLLDRDVDARLDRNFLILDTHDRGVRPVILDLGEDAAVWASGLRRLPS